MNQDLHCSFGPVSSMPGSSHSLPLDTRCDDHPDRLAVKRVQGETDSFGAEYICMCKECYDQYIAEIEVVRATPSRCDWCSSVVADCRPTRDYDEGMSGPVYHVCPACRLAEAKRAAEEADSLEFTIFAPKTTGYTDHKD